MDDEQYLLKNLKAWADEITRVLTSYPDEPDDLPDDQYEAVEILNQMLARGIAIAEVHERFGFSPTVEEFKEGFLQDWMELPKRRMSKGEVMCIAVSTFYKNEIRFSLSGEKDTRMQAAMLAADIMMRAADNCSDLNHDELYASFSREYDIASQKERDDAAVRKSIQRFKASAKVEALVEFKPEEFRFEVVTVEQRLHGLTDKPGRPRSRR